MNTKNSKQFKAFTLTKISGLEDVTFQGILSISKRMIKYCTKK